MPSQRSKLCSDHGKQTLNDVDRAELAIKDAYDSADSWHEAKAIMEGLISYCQGLIDATANRIDESFEVHISHYLKRLEDEGEDHSISVRWPQSAGG